MAKVRSHNEWFRTVFTKTVWGTRFSEWAGDFGMRYQLPGFLKRPYETVVDCVSSRKTCPCCGELLKDGEFVWSWGEYVSGRWNTVTHFCKSCFPKEVKGKLLNHADQCGCTIDLVGKGDTLPTWLTLS